MTKVVPADMTFDREQSWQVIRAQRLAMADLLDDAPHGQWDTPSICAGWRVRDVAAHVALSSHPPGPAAMVGAAVRAAGRFHVLNHDTAVRHAELLGAALPDELRTHAASRTLPPVTNYRNVLPDHLVHLQDVAIPLGRTIDMPVDAAAAGATRVWAMGWPFWAKRRLPSIKLVATDVDWTVGQGPEVLGPIEALLLLLTGRTVSMPRLTGDGLSEL